MKYRKVILISLCFTALVIEVLGTPGSLGQGKSGKLTSQKAIIGSSKSNAKQVANPKAEPPKVSKVSSGNLFSAWGIIFLILSLIGGSALIYYIALFYPMVCAKRGKYDVMEMTAV